MSNPSSVGIVPVSWLKSKASKKWWGEVPLGTYCNTLIVWKVIYIPNTSWSTCVNNPNSVAIVPFRLFESTTKSKWTKIKFSGNSAHCTSLSTYQEETTAFLSTIPIQLESFPSAHSLLDNQDNSNEIFRSRHDNTRSCLTYPNETPTAANIDQTRLGWILLFHLHLKWRAKMSRIVSMIAEQ